MYASFSSLTLRPSFPRLPFPRSVPSEASEASHTKKKQKSDASAITSIATRLDETLAVEAIELEDAPAAVVVDVLEVEPVVPVGDALPVVELLPGDEVDTTPSVNGLTVTVLYGLPALERVTVAASVGHVDAMKFDSERFGLVPLFVLSDEKMRTSKLYSSARSRLSDRHTSKWTPSSKNDEILQ